LQEGRNVLADNVLQLERQVFLHKVVCLLYHSVVVVSCKSDSFELAIVLRQLLVKIGMVELFLLQAVDFSAVTVYHIETLNNAFLCTIKSKLENLQ